MTRRNHGIGHRIGVIVGVLALGTSLAPAAIITVPTTNSNDLRDALNPQGLTITSLAIVNGQAGQFGTYSHFDLLPVTIRPGIVLSSGSVANLAPFAKPVGYSDAGSGSDPNVTAPPPQVNSMMDPGGLGGTAEFDAYGTSITSGSATRIENFQHSHDVAALQVNFHLADASQVRFDFIFASVEYPFYTSSFTDAFLVFLDGKSINSQITFDATGNPVQVGKSFAGLETILDQNTAFADPHGVIHHLTTTTRELDGGDHTLWFEVGDVNDAVLDSAAFITNLRAQAGVEGTEATDDDVPEPATLSLLALGGLVMLRRRTGRVARWA